MEKEYVKRVKVCFNKAALTYDYSTSLQSKVAKKICSFIGDIENNNLVLDVGCGTGYVGQQLGVDDQLYQVDISHEMCCTASRKVKAISTINCDMQFLPFAPDSFDIVVLSMSLHWAVDLLGALRSVCRVQKKSGRGIFISIPVTGTLEELCICNKLLGRNRRFEYYDVSHITHAITSLGCKVEHIECEKLEIHHRTFFDMLSSLVKMGSSAHKYGTDCKVSIMDVCRVYNRLFSREDSVVSSWNIAYLVIKK
ncbi:methyltransferase domain-containing protein [Anaplasma phagocytophilum]|uniref:Methyltransferase domain protein n=3 Tax=Anaplasma phagocytophilum TaxID=948 RepID=A0A0F3NMZ3_ANAPH|nr:methyltransferase domain-containing protein [Anaplasma phagocytophilum]KJZ98882.1 methyltransferase domain protein [Anaplasma phagocytophilum str. CR1007]ABD43706.1 putative biotin synthesis protein BioC [Anaplasma phagocytophilum str. HZ]AGR79169.1 hypothetical protein YYU_00120 [Anaplasma phagocytophilum str. HZ2]AGR80416.1 hypothetical protein WSQ_00120 [Anaplasma phagocytophilum str. JM]AGR81670.1 hypothetical protein YYY_00120 [Anaplasma phagocytophilum str. Dog2]